MPENNCVLPNCTQAQQISDTRRMVQEMHEKLVGTLEEPGILSIIRDNARRIGKVEEDVDKAKGMSFKAVIGALIAMGGVIWRIFTQHH